MGATTRITTREAIRRICELHMIGKVEANRVLTAGRGHRAGSAIVYDVGRVAELLARPPLLGSMLDRWGCLNGGRFPLVATVASWVVFGAEVTGHTYDEGAPPAANRSVPPRTFHVEPPGDWFEPMKETWLPLEHGPTVTVWGAPTNRPLRDVAQVGLTDTDAILRAWDQDAPPHPKIGRDGAA